MLNRPLTFLPRHIEARSGHGVALHTLNERKRPEVEECRATSQRLPHLAEEQDLRRAQQQEPVARLAIRDNLHGIQENRKLLHFVQNDKPGPMIQSADRIHSKAQALVWIIQGVVDGRSPLRYRQEVAH
ncbi:MAG TPA: hypothetical protein VLM91_26245 [Candidatus Methylomirabilis sp.]|nr:hypothetical protein [Candidatus Methylomirabilis sp.]